MQEVKLMSGSQMNRNCLQRLDGYIDTLFPACRRNFFGVVGLTGPFGSRETTGRLPFANGLVRHATKLGHRLQANRFDGF